MSSYLLLLCNVVWVEFSVRAVSMEVTAVPGPFSFFVGVFVCLFWPARLDQRKGNALLGVVVGDVVDLGCFEKDIFLFLAVEQPPVLIEKVFCGMVGAVQLCLLPFCTRTFAPHTASRGPIQIFRTILSET